MAIQTDTFISDDEEELCPLCVEEMDLSDKNFKPCPCGYQVCQFCYNNIRSNPQLNGKCPACRRPYDDESVEYRMVSQEEWKQDHIRQTRKEKERKQKEKEKKESAENSGASKKHLSGMRVIQKNLVYVIGLNPNIPTEELHNTLRGDRFFGQYGKIQKIVINRRNNANGHPGIGVYVTFAKKEDAARCIAAVDGSINDGKYLRAAYGTTKYCSSYLRGQPCPNPNCMFLHEPGEEADSYTRQDLSTIQHAARQGLNKPQLKTVSAGSAMSGRDGSAGPGTRSESPADRDHSHSQVHSQAHEPVASSPSPMMHDSALPASVSWAHRASPQSASNVRLHHQEANNAASGADRSAYTTNSPSPVTPAAVNVPDSSSVASSTPRKVPLHLNDNNKRSPLDDSLEALQESFKRSNVSYTFSSRYVPDKVQNMPCYFWAHSNFDGSTAGSNSTNNTNSKKQNQDTDSEALARVSILLSSFNKCGLLGSMRMAPEVYMEQPQLQSQPQTSSPPGLNMSTNNNLMSNSTSSAVAPTTSNNNNSHELLNHLMRGKFTLSEKSQDKILTPKTSSVSVSSPIPTKKQITQIKHKPAALERTKLCARRPSFSSVRSSSCDLLSLVPHNSSANKLGLHKSAPSPPPGLEQSSQIPVSLVVGNGREAASKLSKRKVRKLERRLNLDDEDNEILRIPPESELPEPIATDGDQQYVPAVALAIGIPSLVGTPFSGPSLHSSSAVGMPACPAPPPGSITMPMAPNIMLPPPHMGIDMSMRMPSHMWPLHPNIVAAPGTVLGMPNMPSSTSSPSPSSPMVIGSGPGTPLLGQIPGPPPGIPVSQASAEHAVHEKIGVVNGLGENVSKLDPQSLQGPNNDKSVPAAVSEENIPVTESMEDARSSPKLPLVASSNNEPPAGVSIGEASTKKLSRRQQKKLERKALKEEYKEARASEFGPIGIKQRFVSSDIAKTSSSALRNTCSPEATPSSSVKVEPMVTVVPEKKKLRTEQPSIKSPIHELNDNKRLDEEPASADSKTPLVLVQGPATTVRQSKVQIAPKADISQHSLKVSTETSTAGQAEPSAKQTAVKQRSQQADISKVLLRKERIGTHKTDKQPSSGHILTADERVDEFGTEKLNGVHSKPAERKPLITPEQPEPPTIDSLFASSFEEDSSLDMCKSLVDRLKTLQKKMESWEEQQREYDTALTWMRKFKTLVELVNVPSELDLTEPVSPPQRDIKRPVSVKDKARRLSQTTVAQTQTQIKIPELMENCHLDSFCASAELCRKLLEDVPDLLQGLKPGPEFNVDEEELDSLLISVDFDSEGFSEYDSVLTELDYLDHLKPAEVAAFPPTPVELPNKLRYEDLVDDGAEYMGIEDLSLRRFLDIIDATSLPHTAGLPQRVLSTDKSPYGPKFQLSEAAELLSRVRNRTDELAAACTQGLDSWP